MADPVEPVRLTRGPCTFLTQNPDLSWTYCGTDAPAIWMHAAAGFYFRCPVHQPSQLDRLATAQRDMP